MEAICLWRATAPRFAYVWVLEEDVGFTGELSTLIDAWRGETADLVAKGCDECVPAPPPQCRASGPGCCRSAARAPAWCPALPEGPCRPCCGSGACPSEDAFNTTWPFRRTFSPGFRQTFPPAEYRKVAPPPLAPLAPFIRLAPAPLAP